MERCEPIRKSGGKRLIYLSVERRSASWRIRPDEEDAVAKVRTGCESGFRLTALISQLPPMAGLIPLESGAPLCPLLRTEGMENSPLSTSPTLVWRGGVFRRSRRTPLENSYGGFWRSQKTGCVIYFDS